MPRLRPRPGWSAPSSTRRPQADDARLTLGRGAHRRASTTGRWPPTTPASPAAPRRQRPGAPAPGLAADGTVDRRAGLGGGQRRRRVGRRRCGLDGGDTRSIRPAKGVHITVPAEPAAPTSPPSSPCPRTGVGVRGPVAGADRVYVGTTDTDYDGALDDPDVHRRRRGVPAGRPQRVACRPPSPPADVLGTWAGLRPLVADGPCGSGAHRRPVPAPPGRPSAPTAW